MFHPNYQIAGKILNIEQEVSGREKITQKLIARFFRTVCKLSVCKLRST